MASTSDPIKAFRTHSNYLDAIDACIRSIYAPAGKHYMMLTAGHVLPGLDAAVRATGWFSQSQVKKNVDVDQVVASLRNAWGTELLLEMSGGFESDEMISVSNNWAVIWVYYVLYHATQALVVARGQPRPASHPATQNAFAQNWCSSKSDLVPWSLGIDASGCLNVPAGKSVQKVHAWSGCDSSSCWSLAAKALGTTRDDRFEEKRKELRLKRQVENRKLWEKEEAARVAAGRKQRKKPKFALPNLAPADKAAIDKKLRVTTMMDYLYRLRIRSNYVDTEMFTEGPENPMHSRSVHRTLRLITSTSLFLHELHVGALLGRQTFEPIVKKWLADHAYSKGTAGLPARQPLLFT